MPRLAEIIERIDTRIRKRLSALADLVDSASDSPARDRATTCIRAASRWLLHIPDICRHHYDDITSVEGMQPISSVTELALTRSLEALRNVDASLIRRRMPWHRFERSEGELIMAALTSACSQIEEALSIANEIDPDFHERLLADERPPFPARIA